MELSDVLKRIDELHFSIVDSNNFGFVISPRDPSEDSITETKESIDIKKLISDKIKGLPIGSLIKVGGYASNTKFSTGKESFDMEVTLEALSGQSIMYKTGTAFGKNILISFKDLVNKIVDVSVSICTIASDYATGKIDNKSAENKIIQLLTKTKNDLVKLNANTFSFYTTEFNYPAKFLSGCLKAYQFNKLPFKDVLESKLTSPKYSFSSDGITVVAGYSPKGFAVVLIRKLVSGKIGILVRFKDDKLDWTSDLQNELSTNVKSYIINNVLGIKD